MRKEQPILDYGTSVPAKPEVAGMFALVSGSVGVLTFIAGVILTIMFPPPPGELSRFFYLFPIFNLSAILGMMAGAKVLFSRRHDRKYGVIGFLLGLLVLVAQLILSILGV